MPDDGTVYAEEISKTESHPGERIDLFESAHKTKMT